MHHYGVRDVERLLRLPRSTIRALVDAGFVAPARGPRRAWLFSFQDLIVLRAARALVAAKVPPRRITRSMKELRRHLPDAMPLSGLAISAEGDHVVVRQGGGRWHAETGQYLLAFEGDPEDGSLSVIERGRAGSGSVEGWLEKGVALESNDPGAAIDAYSHAIAADAECLDAHINLGRLLHEAGRLEEAERAYRDGMRACGKDPLLLYNLGVLLDDMERKAEAMKAYQAALRADPQFADCHYNLALLCEQLGRPKEAIRHMSQYRKLAAVRPD